MSLLLPTPPAQRWLVGVFVFIAGALLLGGLWFHQREIVAMRAERYADLDAIAGLKTGQLVAWRQERLADARVSTAGLRLHDAMPVARTIPAGPQRARLHAYLEEMRAAYRYADVILATPAGRPLMQAVPTTRDLAAELRPVMARALAARQPVVGDFQRTAPGAIVLDVAAPILDAAGRIVAVLILRTDPEDQLYPLIQSWPTPSASAETLLVQRDGNDVLFLNELRHRSGTALTLRIPLSRAGVPAVQAVRGHTGIFRGTDYRGVAVASDIRPIPDSPWYMVAKIDSREILAEARYRSGAILTFIVLGLLAILAVAGLTIALQRRNLYKTLYQLEYARREAQEEIRATLYGIGDGVIATDAAGRVTRMNPVAETLTGWDEVEAIGQPVTEVFHIVNEETRETVENPVDQVLRDGMIAGLANHSLLIARDGHERPIADSGAPIHRADAIAGAVLVFRDQSEQHEHALRREMALDVLALLNGSNDTQRLLDELLQLIKERTGIEAIGIRLQEGNCFTYCTTSGFSEAFLKAEGVLCPNEDDGMLPCLCGSVLQGRTDPSQPCFTATGSFWTNAVSEPLALTPESVVHARLRCSAAGYESIALIPLRTGAVTVGLLQLNDRRRGLFTPEMIHFFEGIGASIGIALARRRSAETLQAGEERYHRTFSTVADALFILDQATGAILDANDTACAMYGYPRERFLTMSARDLLATLPATGGPGEYLPISDHRRQDGTGFPVEVTTSYYHEGSRILRVLAIRDISARRQAELQADAAARETQRMLDIAQRSRLTLLSILEDEKQAMEERAALELQLHQQQRLETVGQLAAGVAHDFNNLLTGITGYTLFAHESQPEGSSTREDLAEVLTLAKRAADLTHQLLAFSRRQPLQPVVININGVISESAKMLQRLLGEHLHLEVNLAAQLDLVKVDPGQFEQILVNLAVNARDAMRDGGKLTIETTNVILDEAYTASHVGTRPGAYVMLAVTDTGIGIDATIIEQIFEPFFTTKGVGAGTGLGLSTVYGIVKQHGGNIWVYSEVGHGTTFKVYLPRTVEDGSSPMAAPPAQEPISNTTILIVEDNEAVLLVAQRYLEAAGYRVLTAALPSEAEAVLQEYGETIAVMLTDVVMPEQSGRQLYESVRLRFPHLRVLYMSGYTANAIVHDGVLDPGTPFIEKPFTAASLTQKVHAVLTGGAHVE
jgi:two-component system cell cycle sensor histidine kinase/response regulator CckA